VQNIASGMIPRMGRGRDRGRGRSPGQLLAVIWSAWTGATRHPGTGSIGCIRQWTESVNDTLKGQLDLERHGGRTTEGRYARTAQRLLAMAACIWHKWTVGELAKRSLIAFDN
jgi:hypothetical protein